MASDTKTPVVLCWHMHQPSYQDMRTNQFLFPWVYLHTIKDYSDMAAHLEANPPGRWSISRLSCLSKSRPT